jgi:hypothetical protein
MRFGVVEILLLGALCCVPLVVIIGVIVGIVFLNKRLSPSSWFRKILAVVTGVIVDLGGTNVVSGIYTVILAFGLVAKYVQQNLSPIEIQEKLTAELIAANIGLSIPMIVFGILLSVLGGYVAGKIARQNEIVYGFATGIGVILVSVTLTLLMGLPTQIQNPIWQFVLGLVINIGSTTLGGYLALLQRKRKEANFIPNNPETPQTP